MTAARRMWTADEYHRMAEVSILHEDDRVELIDGEIIQLEPISSRHAACTSRLNKLLHHRLNDDVIISAGNPIRFDQYTEVQPDIAVLHFQSDWYASAHPMPSDVLLIMEVADTSLNYDQHVKLPRYAEAGIAEVWTVNVGRSMLTRYTEPRQSFYATQQHAGRGDAIQSSVFPDLLLAVDEVCG
jgi:Uma2 family endonuclease